MSEVPNFSPVSGFNEGRALHDYLAAVDWRAPSDDENILIHRANRSEDLTPGEMAIVSIVKGSFHAINPPTDRILQFIKKEELLSALEGQIDDPYERRTQASDPLLMLREANPELHQASMQARRNVGVNGLPALHGVDLQSITVKK